MVTKWGKIWIGATVVSMFLYNLRWTYGNITTVCSTLASISPFASYPEWRFWVDRILSGIVGNGFRLAGNIITFTVLFMLWRAKPESFTNVKRKVSWALVCEAVYWLTVLPISIIELLFLERVQLLELAFVIQIVLTSSLLILLAKRTWNFDELKKLNALKLVGIAAVGYLVGIWFNNVFRWLSMEQATEITFIVIGWTGFGFFSTLITLSASLVLAVASFYTMFQRSNIERAIKMAGAALIFLGLNFAIYVIFSELTYTLNYVFLVEFWPVTFLGLGVGMLRGKI